MCIQKLEWAREIKTRLGMCKANILAIVIYHTTINLIDITIDRYNRMFFKLELLESFLLAGTLHILLRNCNYFFLPRSISLHWNISVAFDI